MNDANSPMANLVAIRENIASKQVLKLRIPRWDDPEILVSYKILDQPEYQRSLASILEVDPKDTKGRAEASLNANMDLLIRACTGIELRGTEIKGTFGGFGKEVAEAVGLPVTSARSVCEWFFIADGDMNQHVNRLVQWSGFAATEIEDDFSGE